MKITNSSSATFTSSFLAVVLFSVVTLTGCDSKTNSATTSNKPIWATKIDKDGDGKISTEEVKAIDANKDGKITREEAQQLAMPEVDFKKLDKDGNGELTPEEMRTYGG